MSEERVAQRTIVNEATERGVAESTFRSKVISPLTIEEKVKPIRDQKTSRVYYTPDDAATLRAALDLYLQKKAFDTQPPTPPPRDPEEETPKAPPIPKTQKPEDFTRSPAETTPARRPVNVIELARAAGPPPPPAPPRAPATTPGEEVETAEPRSPWRWVFIGGGILLALIGLNMWMGRKQPQRSQPTPQQAPAPPPGYPPGRITEAEMRRQMKQHFGR